MMLGLWILLVLFQGFLGIYHNKGSKCFDWGNVGIAFGVGFAAGFAYPFVGTTLVSSLVSWGVANTAQYALTQLSNNQPITTMDLDTNASALFETWFEQILLPSLDNHTIQTKQTLYHHLR